jgi:hypothetical protein
MLVRLKPKGPKEVIRGQFHFALLCAQIPKEQKKIDSLTLFFALLGSGHIKAERKMLVNATPGPRIYINLEILAALSNLL